MAKGLKPGDAVTVAATYRFKRTSPEAKKGLKSIEPGEVGHVVKAAPGHSLVVEFNGIQGTIASRWLQLASDQPKPVARPGRPKRAAQAAAKVPTPSASAEKSPALKSETPGYDRRWMTALANRLLVTGNTKPDKDAAIEIRLGDLPEDLQEQILALVQAKLELGLEADESEP